MTTSMNETVTVVTDRDVPVIARVLARNFLSYVQNFFAGRTLEKPLLLNAETFRLDRAVAALSQVNILSNNDNGFPTIPTTILSQIYYKAVSDFRSFAESEILHGRLDMEQFQKHYPDMCFHDRNTNPITGVSYGVINVNNLDPRIKHEIDKLGQPEVATAFYDFCRDEIRMHFDSDPEHDSYALRYVAMAYTTIPLPDSDDVEELLRHIPDGAIGIIANKFCAMDVSALFFNNIKLDDFIYTGRIDDINVTVSFSGDIPIMLVVCSPYRTHTRPCSPRTVGAGNLNNVDSVDGIECYDVPASWCLPNNG